MKQRHVRIFPQRIDALDKWLTPAECWAYVKLDRHYCERDGLPDDNVLLARCAELKPAKWLALRTKLEHYGICHAVDGRWIDPDQDENIAMQKRASQRGSAGGSAAAANRLKRV